MGFLLSLVDLIHNLGNEFSHFFNHGTLPGHRLDSYTVFIDYDHRHGFYTTSSSNAAALR